MKKQNAKNAKMPPRASDARKDNGCGRKNLTCTFENCRKHRHGDDFMFWAFAMLNIEEHDYEHLICE